MPEIEVIGHRGCKGLEPENTLLGFRKAINLGVDSVEFDVRLTKDKKPVIIHDAFLERTTNGLGLVKDKTLSQLKKLQTDKSEKIPELKEVIKLCKGKVRMHIELKEDSVIQVLDLIKKHKVKDEVILTSFNLDYLKKSKKLMPEINTGFIFAKKPANLIAIAKKAKVFSLQPLTLITNKVLVKLAHDNNIKIMPWTANNLKEVIRLKELKVDGIYTDYPDRLLKVLNK